MKLKKLTRKEKEALYIKEMTRLQLHWGNPIDSDWSFVSKCSDEEIEKGINDTIEQLKFEKFFSYIGIIIKIIVIAFILLGIVGLLIFGIRQLF